jgi:transposase-like protein
MSGKRYTEEFKIAAVKQATERGHPAAEVAERDILRKAAAYFAKTSG